MDYIEVITDALLEAKRAIDSFLSEKRNDRVLGIGASGDPTYEIDKVAEDAILKSLRRSLPRFLALTEESGLIGSLEDRPIVLIDPVDGSTNASRGLPLFSSSIAIAEGDRFDDIVASGVLDLVHGDLIVGTRRKVFHNGSPASPSRLTDLDRSLQCLDGREEEGWSFVMDGVIKFLQHVRHPRLLGSAALETAYVAVGKVDAYIQPWPRLRTYDCLPALYLVKEAGGALRFLHRLPSNPYLLDSARALAYVAAGSQELCDKIFSFFKGDGEA